MVNGAKRLPDGWEWMTLKQVSKEIYRYPTFYGMEHLHDGVPVIRGEHILGNGTISHDWTDYWFVSQEYSGKFPKTVVETGDLIMSVRGRVGKIGIVDEPLKNAQVSPNCIRISTKRDRCVPKFLFYYLKSSSAQLAISNNVNATTIQTIKASLLSTTPVPLPSLREQERIVNRIEELFSDLEAGVAALERVRAGLKRYKASVLKAACEGKLFESREIENGELPEGWQRVTVGDVAISMKNGIYKPAEFYADDGIACLRMYNIEDGAIVWKDIKRMILTDDEIETYRLSPGDILVNRVNSRELVGKAAVIPDGFETTIYESKNIRLKINEELADSKFINFCFGAFRQQYFNYNAQQVVGMASINQTQIAQMPIPLPPLDEQRRIVAEVERRLSVVGEVESAVEVGLVRAGRLRQAVLRSAFEGRL